MALGLPSDPLDEKRQYALQAVDPTNSSENPLLAEPGANFLAVEALPLFPMIPDKWGSQSGFDRDSAGRFWRWLIWQPPITADVLQSLLRLDPEVVGAARHRRAIGIVEIYQAAIVQPSRRYRCFTPARSL